MTTLKSYVRGEWVAGKGAPYALVNPTSEEVLAEASTEGIDMAATLAFARTHGSPALRAMTLAERAAMLDAVVKALHTHREALLDLAVANGGNTRSDAKFDVDGAIGTLAHYAKLGATLGSRKVLLDGEVEQLGKSPRFVGRHAYLPMQGVAVLINAFNFPAWGLFEKAAAAWLAGMPVLAKPATSTALVAHRMVEILVEAKALPQGALSLLCGSAGDLLSHLTHRDVVAFTGSSNTARTLRQDARILAQSVRLNVEADSLNSAVLGPDVTTDSDTYALFLREVAKDITQKAGQKCTAIRRIFVPRALLDDVRRDLADALAQVKVGDPAQKEVGMGPLATAQQLRDVRAGAQKLLAHGKAVFGDAGRAGLVGVAEGKGFFITPTLVAFDDAATPIVHEHEVFGPVSSLLPYDGEVETVAQAVRLGGGSLVSSVYSDDGDFARACVFAFGADHGRLHLGSAKMAEQSTGPGTVLPQLQHGGPGRAGGGAELGGLRALSLYMQRVAVQGFASALERLFD